MMAVAGEEGGLWRPANPNEMNELERDWCRHRINRDGDGDWEDEFGQLVPGSCVICINSLCGDFPDELIIRNGMPWCKAFRQDPQRPARCLFTKEMVV